MQTLQQPNFLNLLRKKDILILPLQMYLQMHSHDSLPKDFMQSILLIKNVKRKKMKLEFHEIFSQLIEDITFNLKKEDIEKDIFDNFAIVQIFLVSIVVQWIYTKNEIKLSKKQIQNALNPILAFIKSYYGNSYINIMSVLELFKEDEIKKDKPSSIEVMKSTANIIKNFHPIDFDILLSSYYINNYKEISQYKIEFPKIASSKKPIKELFSNILANLLIIKGMHKYKVKSRLNFFFEFKDENYLLPQINDILLKTGRKKLINLVNMYEDEDLVKEKIQYLISKVKESKEYNTKIMQELEMKIRRGAELNRKISDLKMQINILSNELKYNKIKLGKSQKINDNLLNEILNLNQGLNESETKRNNYSFRESCRKIEEYFFNIITPHGRNEIINLYKKINNPKINLICDKINEEYPLIFEEIKKNSIDWKNFLINVSTFRKENNNEIHDKTKINSISLTTTLNNYFDKRFDFGKPLNYFIKNFYNFNNYLFNEDCEVEDFSEIFQKKEKMMK